MRAPRRAGALLSAAVLIGALTACSGDEGGETSDKSPDEVMELAKTELDETEGVTLKLSADALPEGVSGLVSAEGTATHAPAFDGTIVVIFGGMNAEVPVRAVDGKVYAQVPLTTGWSEVDPADYQAPDPAELIDPDQGVSNLLVSTEDLQKGDSVRGGQDNADILTTYSGTVPGEVMKGLLPSADGDEFDVDYEISDDGQLRGATLTGVFYPDSEEMTYTVTLDDYGQGADVSAPDLG